jgi:hypothetical protein
VIDDDVQAEVRAALDLAGSTAIDGGALDGVSWAADADRVVQLHPAWRAVEILPEHVRDGLRIGRLDLVAGAFACRATGTWGPLLACVNAWCYGGSEHGVERTSRILALPHTEARLEGAVATLDADGAVEAYYLLSSTGHVHGWGPALFTRFLDAADRRESDRALGLDPALAGAVNGLVPGSDLGPADWSTAEYAFYLGLLHRVATEVGAAPVAVEAALAAKFAD